MKKFLFVLFIFPIYSTFSQTTQQIENQKAFSRLYGYLKYFYPGDEAAKINWDKFSIYGAEKIDGCKSTLELRDSLQAMIYPVMPGVQIVETSKQIFFNKQQLTPANLSNYLTVSWQHQGVGLQKDSRSPYVSSRTNRARIIKNKPGFAVLSSSIVATDREQKTFIFSAKAKMLNGTGDGHLWIRVDKKNKAVGFFDNMADNPITSQKWQEFTIKGKVDKNAINIVFGTFLSGTGSFAFDDLSLKIEDKGTFKEVYFNDFNNERGDGAPQSLHVSNVNGNYKFKIANESNNPYVTITGEEMNSEPLNDKTPLFAYSPKFGEYIEKDLGAGLKALIPLVLYGTKTNTFPVPDSVASSKLVNAINTLPEKSLSGQNLYTRIGDIINTWNVFQHFYPYFGLTETNWYEDQEKALQEAYVNKTIGDFSQTLQKLTAKLNDGHIFVYNPNSESESFVPPIAWKWVENQLIITSVLDTSLSIQTGDLVTEINGQAPRAFFAQVEQYISAATKGWLNYRSQTESLKGKKDTKIKLTFTNQKNQTKNLELKRSLTSQEYVALLPQQEKIKQLSSDITYISLSTASMQAIKDALPVLMKSKSIIFDLRGYPLNNAEIVTHLMTKADTSSHWMQIPQITYPDQEKINGYRYESWDLKPAEQHLNAKIFFLIDGRAISSAESIMGFIENYKLATIIGQPTAGTNGNVNQFTLPGGFTVRFTGMKVYKHDGSQHHGIGIAPNIYVEQTMKGIRENRDEILERAILEATKYLN